MRDELLTEREKTHGKFSDTAYISQHLKYQVRHLSRSKLDTTKQEVLDMIMVKIARVLSGNPNEVDHWKDIAGYARLAEESCI